MIWIEIVFVFVFYQTTVHLFQSAAGLAPARDPLDWIYRRFLALGILGLWCWFCYVIKAPAAVVYALPLITASVMVFRHGSKLLEGSRQSFLVVHAVVSLGLLSLLLTLSHFNGGGWAADWIEHYERTLFFTGQLPPETTFLSGSYSLTARPPLNNTLTAFFIQPVGSSFAAFQVAALCLSAEVLWGVFALLATFKRTHFPLLCLAGLLCLASPVFVQNALFPWTKSLTAAFVLAAIACIAQDHLNPDKRHLIRFGFLMAAAILVHYSAAVFLAGAGLWLIWSDLGRRRIGFAGFFKRLWPGALTGALVIALWIGWAFWQFGLSDSLGATTTVSDTASLTWNENLSKTVYNINNTIVPHFIRDVNPFAVWAVFSPHPIASARDFFFNLSQVNLFYFGGFFLPMIWFGLLLQTTYRPERSLLIAFLIISTISFFLGIAVHGGPDSLGLMHICLQPLLYFAIVYIVCISDRIPANLLVFLLILVSLTLLTEVALHTALMSLSVVDWLILLPTGSSVGEIRNFLGPNIYFNLGNMHSLNLSSAGEQSGVAWITGYFLYLFSCLTLLIPVLQWRFQIFTGGCPAEQIPER